MKIAFDALFDAAKPQLQERALKAAIPVLVSERRAEVLRPLRNNGVRTVLAPAVSWETLRPRLQAIAIRTQAERETMAAALGLATTTLSRMLSHKKGAGPGAMVLARAVDYLVARDDESADSESTELPSADHGDEVRVDESVSGTRINAGGNGTKPAVASAHIVPRGPQGPGRPHKTMDGPGRLSAELRQVLQFLIERDPKAVRREAGIGLELARQAADGVMVPPVVLPGWRSLWWPINGSHPGGMEPEQLHCVCLRRVQFI